MPNWCEGDLTVTGPYTERAVFKEFVRTVPANPDDPFLTVSQQVMARIKNEPEPKENVLDTNKIIPNPDGENAENWYDWNIEHWGTKWGICNAKLSRGVPGSRSLFYSFETAWSPCTPVVQRMGELFPKLTFNYRYYEAGMGFAGQLVMKGGKIQTETSRDNYRGRRGG